MNAHECFIIFGSIHGPFLIMDVLLSRSGEGGDEGAVHLLEGGLGIVALGGGLPLVTEDELYLLHAESSLVEERAAGVAGEVPVEVLLQPGDGGQTAEVEVTLTVGADGGEVLR